MKDLNMFVKADFFFKWIPGGAQSRCPKICHFGILII